MGIILADTDPVNIARAFNDFHSGIIDGCNAVQRRSFNYVLPPSLSITKRGADEAAHEDGTKPPPKKVHKGNDDNKTKKGLVKNDQPISGIAIPEGKTWKDLFPTGKVPNDKVPKFNNGDISCCVRFHVGKICPDGPKCKMASSHNKPDASTQQALKTFLAEARSE
jgi:hypothetical protein